MLDIKGNESIRRVYGVDGNAPCLQTMQGGNREPKIQVKSATKQGYELAEFGDSINLSVHNSETRRGRVGKQVAQTLDTQCNQAIVDYRIRKLTPRECLRLQDFPDTFKQVVSDSQLYKQAGNSMTVAVLEMIFRQIEKSFKGRNRRLILTLRPYQSEAVEKAREAFKQGHRRICLTLATGAGKSVIIQNIVKNAKGKVLYLTFRNVLIDQMARYFKDMNIEYGTLQKYGKNETEMYDLIIIDEIHWAHSSKLQNNLRCKYLLGLTATPITAQGYALDFDEIIDIVQLVDLIEMGYAAPIKVLSTSKVDTSNLKSVGGDFNQKDAYALMAKSAILKDIVNVYNTHAKGLKTIVYAVNIKHAEELKEEFFESWN